MTTPEVFVARDAELLAEAVAARLVTRIVDLQAATGLATVALGGGPLVDSVLAEVAGSPARDAVDWQQIDVWWADELFLPAGDPARHDSSARRLLLDAVGAPPARTHPVPGPDEFPDAETAAATYAGRLADAVCPPDHGPAPAFDLLLVAVTPDGGVAGLAPEQPAVHDGRPAVAAHTGGPSRPPHVTLTLPSLGCAREVWLLAAGGATAPAVRLTVAGAGPVQVPASGVRGLQRTLLLLDEAAADRLPAQLRRIASP